MKLAVLLPLLCLTIKGWGFAIGNPAQPSLTPQGVLPYKNCYYSIRASYSNDYIYSQQFRGQLNVGLDEEKPPINQLSSDTTQLTINFINRIDLYGIVGSARLQMDREVYCQNQFAWGAGAKVTLFEANHFHVGCDFKYFQTDQKPSYFVSTGKPLELASEQILSYQEYQAAMGIAYHHELFCPYLAATYINAKIDPSQKRFLVRIPEVEDLMEANTKHYINANTWGMAIGGTLVMGDKGTLTIESRFLNQNAIDASLDIRF